MALSYGLEKDQVIRALGLEPNAGLRIKLGDIAKQQGLTLQDLQAITDALPHD